MMNNDRVKCLYTVCNWVEQLSVFLAQAYSIGSIFPPWDCLEMSLLHSLFLLILWINFSFSKTKMYQDIHTTVISPCIYSIRLKLTMPWMYAIYSNHVIWWISIFFFLIGLILGEICVKQTQPPRYFMNYW